MCACGLITAKRAAGRPKDLLVLPELESLLDAENDSDGQKKSSRTGFQDKRGTTAPFASLHDHARSRGKVYSGYGS